MDEKLYSKRQTASMLGYSYSELESIEKKIELMGREQYEFEEIIWLSVMCKMYEVGITPSSILKMITVAYDLCAKHDGWNILSYPPSDRYEYFVVFDEKAKIILVVQDDIKENSSKCMVANSTGMSDEEALTCCSGDGIAVNFTDCLKSIKLNY